MPDKQPEDLRASLRSEIVESQKARIDLLKYKLLAVAALGAFGLGAGHGEDEPMSSMYIYAFCFIPFVCVYIDLLCYHNTLRIRVIGNYLNAACRDPYERFIEDLKKCSPREGFFFELEDWALQWSSVVLSLILALAGFLDRLFWQVLCYPKWIIFMVVGIAGCALSVIAWQAYEHHVSFLRACTARCSVPDTTSNPAATAPKK